MMPVMVHNVLESSHLLQTGVKNFQEKCVDGISVNKKHCEELIEKSLAMVTSRARYWI